MISKAKEVGVYIDMPNEEQVNEMFQEISGHMFALKNNKRYEKFSLHSFTIILTV